MDVANVRGEEIRTECGVENKSIRRQNITNASDEFTGILVE